MLEHYSHARLAAKRAAVEGLGSQGTGRVTVQLQSGNSGNGTEAQDAENIGGREGIRTPGLLVANEALSQLSYSPTSSKEILAEAYRVANRLSRINGEAFNWEEQTLGG
jgi:hypothetical protein